MGSPCPKCGYMPNHSEEESQKQVRQFVASWKKPHQEVFFKQAKVMKAFDKKGRFWSDCLNFLSRMTNEGMSSLELLQQMMTSLGDSDFVPKLARADRQWPYLAETISRRRRSLHG